MLRAPALLALAFLLLTGCGAVEASASAPKAAAATPSLPCFLPYGTHVALVSPAPGSTGATAISSVIIAASRELPKSVALVATEGRGTAGSSIALERTIAPMHAVHVPFPNPVFYRAAAGLHAHRHYTIALDDIAQNGCAPLAAMTGNARFST